MDQRLFSRNPGKGAVDVHVRWGRWKRLETGGPGEQKAAACAPAGRGADERGVCGQQRTDGGYAGGGAGAGAVTVKEG